MSKQNTISLLFNCLTPLLISFLVFFVTKEDISYLETINRSLVISPIVFPIVWTILYVLMGIWAFLYEKENDDLTMIIYWISLFANLLFSFILFSFHLIVLAFIDVIILFILILYLFIKTLLKQKKYAYLLLPYLIWLVIAFFLMRDLVIFN